MDAPLQEKQRLLKGLELRRALYKNLAEQIAVPLRSSLENMDLDQLRFYYMGLEQLIRAETIAHNNRIRNLADAGRW